MNKLKNLSCLLVLGMYMPLQAQVVYEDIADNDSSEVTDVAVMDTLSDDSVALPWPQNAQARIDKLLTHDMFETSQLGMMVYDLTADSVIYAHNERQLMRLFGRHRSTVFARHQLIEQRLGIQIIALFHHRQQDLVNAVRPFTDANGFGRALCYRTESLDLDAGLTQFFLKLGHEVVFTPVHQG